MIYIKNIAIIITIAFIVSFIVRKCTKLLYKQGKAKEVAVKFLASFITAVIWVAAGYAALNQFEFFKSAMALLMTGSGVLVVVLAFVSQEAIGNVIDGLILIFSNVFEVGDVIILKDSDIKGTVKSITMNHTEILSFENNLLVVPNKTMKNSIIENLRANDVMCNFLSLQVAYGTNLDKVEKIIKKIVRNHKYYIDNRTEEEKKQGKEDVGFLVTSWENSGITIRISVWTKAENGFYILCDLRRQLLDAFNEEHIEIPYPHIQILTKIGK